MDIRTQAPDDASLIVRVDPAGPRKIHRALALVAGFVLLGGAIQVALAPATVVPWLLVATGIGILAFTWLDRRHQLATPVLAVTADHAWFRVGSRDLVGVPAAQIIAVRTADYGGASFVRVEAPDAAEDLHRDHPRLWQRTAHARVAHKTPFAVTDSGKDIPLRQITAALTALKEAGERD